MWQSYEIDSINVNRISNVYSPEESNRFPDLAGIIATDSAINVHMFVMAGHQI
jgi:hypothetical protein